MKTKTFVMLLFMFGLGLLTGLFLMSHKPVPLPSIWVEPFLGEVACPLPCWQNITPGRTTMTEAKETLANAGLQLVDEGVTFQGQWANFKFPLLSNLRFNNRITLRNSDKQNNWVTEIEVAVADDGIYLKHVTEELGEPDGVLFLSRGESDVFTWWSFGLIYLNRGAIVSSSGNVNIVGNMSITPGMEVSRIEFFDPSNKTELEHNIGLSLNELIPWKGYGYYKVP